MTCPACKPDAQCSACLAEELARRGQQHNLQKACGAISHVYDELAAQGQRHTAELKRVLAKRHKGRPRKPKSEHLVSLHVSVHPGFLASLPEKSRGLAIEQAFGFTRPTAGQMEMEKA